MPTKTPKGHPPAKKPMPMPANHKHMTPKEHEQAMRRHPKKGR